MGTRSLQQEKEPPFQKRYRTTFQSQQTMNPRVIESDSQEQEEMKYLVTLNGVYNLETKQYEAQQWNIEWSDMAACQLDNVLYLCGGKKYPLFSGNLLTKTYKGEFGQQQPMKTKRSCVGLSGVGSELAAVGGRNYEVLKVFETYSLKEKKWKTQPDLNIKRSWPGVCIFQSRDIFCFCGLNQKPLKSIEKIALNSQKPKWIKLQNTQSTANYHLKAIPYRSNILVFGGHFKDGKLTPMIQNLTKQGKEVTKGDYSPLLQGRSPCVTYNNSVFAVYIQGGQDVIKAYDGLWWKQQYPEQ